MAVIILLIVGVVAVSVLLGCLRGFGRARRQRKVVGLLLRVETESTGRREEKGARQIEFPRYPRRTADTTHTYGLISNNTVAVVGLAILLGSR